MTDSGFVPGKQKLQMEEADYVVENIYCIFHDVYIFLCIYTSIDIHKNILVIDVYPLDDMSMYKYVPSYREKSDV